MNLPMTILRVWGIKINNNENDIPKLPNCEFVNEFGFYVPNHQDLTDDNINKITNIINKYE